MLNITEEAAYQLDRQFVVRDINKSGNPQLLIKVPDLASSEAEVGVEVRQEKDNCVVISLLLYDIPTEPVSYEMRFYPDEHEDLRFLHSFIDTAKFRLYPCSNASGQWEVGATQSYRVPANVLLRLKHFSLDWPDLANAPKEKEFNTGIAPPANEQLELTHPVLAEDEDDAEQAAAHPPKADPRDMTIQKLKEQNQALRTQLRHKDKRIIELEDKLAEIKSRGRSYRLSGSDKKSWWKPF